MLANNVKGKEFLNKMVGEGEMQTEDRDEITIGEEYDRVYKGVNDPVLKDSGIGKTVSMILHNILSTIVVQLTHNIISSPYSTLADCIKYCWIRRHCTLESLWR